VKYLKDQTEGYKLGVNFLNKNGWSNKQSFITERNMNITLVSNHFNN